MPIGTRLNKAPSLRFETQNPAYDAAIRDLVDLGIGVDLIEDFADEVRSDLIHALQAGSIDAELPEIVKYWSDGYADTASGENPDLDVEGRILAKCGFVHLAHTIRSAIFIV